MTLREEVELLGETAPWWPLADWQDEGLFLVLLLDVPAADPQSLSLTEEGNELTVRGERHLPAALLHSERPSGSFSRTFNFPEEVIPGSGQASLAGGVLSIRFEKKCPTIDIGSS